MLRITKDTCIIDRLNIQISITAELWDLNGYETNGEDLPSILDFQINFAGNKRTKVSRLHSVKLFSVCWGCFPDSFRAHYLSYILSRAPWKWEAPTRMKCICLPFILLSTYVPDAVWALGLQNTSQILDFKWLWSGPIKKSIGQVYEVCMFSVAQSCLTLCSSMDYSLPGSSVHGIFQARILEGLPFPSPGNPPNPGVKPSSLESPELASRFFAISTTWETAING